MYDSAFAREVYDQVDSGAEIKTCMQCGVCAASCPLSLKMDYSPRKIFTLIRAGKRDEVLGSRAILLCTSCYSCKVRCPRQIPVINVMHGLAHYAIENKLAHPEAKETIDFGRAFWGSIDKLGRIDESMVPVKFMMADGIGAGIKKMLAFKSMGLNMLKHKRMKLMPGKPIKGIKGFKKMLDKAGTMPLAHNEGGKS